MQPPASPLPGAHRPPIGGSADAAALIGSAFADLSHEQLRVLHLDRRFALCEVAVMDGAHSSISLPLRAIVRDALRLDTAMLIVAHNHPGGDLRPSQADLRATRQLLQVGRALDIALIDHLLFAGTEWISFRASGLL